MILLHTFFSFTVQLIEAFIHSLHVDNLIQGKLNNLLFQSLV